MSGLPRDCWLNLPYGGNDLGLGPGSWVRFTMGGALPAPRFCCRSLILALQSRITWPGILQYLHLTTSLNLLFLCVDLLSSLFSRLTSVLSCSSCDNISPSFDLRAWWAIFYFKSLVTSPGILSGCASSSPPVISEISIKDSADLASLYAASRFAGSLDNTKYFNWFLRPFTNMTRVSCSVLFSLAIFIISLE